MFLVDSHCHLDLLDLTPDDVNNVVKRAQAAGVKHILNVCVDVKDFPTVLKTAEQYPFVSASVGLHPNYQESTIDSKTLLEYAKHPKVIAIGETGLDYYRSTGDLDWQRERFRMHIAVAKSCGKQLIIHTRNAREDTIAIMQEETANEIGGVMHCFSEDWATAKRALDLNFYISFSGIVTFKNAAVMQEAAKKVPLDRLLIETDSPYLAPIPFRGKPNEPAYVRHTAEFLAQLKGVTLEELAEATTNNFFKLFSGAVRQNV